MAIEVFQRREKKYLMDTAVMRQIQSQLDNRLVPDAYNRNQAAYSIANLYFDTPDHLLIRRSLQKPFYKEKLRLRAYGIPAPDDFVFFEIKKKYNGVVYKRRSRIRLKDACAFAGSGRLPPEEPGQNRQVLREIAAMLNFYPLRPAVMIAYERRAWFDSQDSSLRVSVDSAIRSRRTDLSLESGLHGKRLLPDGVWLMEIKSSAGLPCWLTRTLAEQAIFARSFSKYGAEYRRLTGQASDRFLQLQQSAGEGYAGRSLTPATI